MNKRRSLIVDADVELAHESGSRINLRLDSGQGVIEFSDAALFRKIIRNSLLSRQLRNTLQRTLQLVDIVNPKIDISVVGKRIAQVDTGKGGGYIWRLLGLPGLKVWPFALISVLFR